MLRAVLDADVFYALPLRDTLLSAAEAGCFQPVWSDEILDEMARNLVKDGPATSARLCCAPSWPTASRRRASRVSGR